MGVASFQNVDQVVKLGKGNLEDLIKILKPHVLVLGKEFEIEREDEFSDAVTKLKEQGGLILYHAGEKQYASSDFLQEYLPEKQGKSIKLFNAATNNHKTQIIIQEFIEDVKNGDKRILILNGKPEGFVNRIPRSGQFKANLHLGGRAERTMLTQKEKKN